MTSPGGDAPPATGGEFLLQLLQRAPNFALPTHSTHQPPSQNFTQDPAVAAVGPSISTFRVPHAPFPLNAQNLPYPTWNHFSPPTFPPLNYIHQNPNANPNLNPDFSSPPAGFNYASSQIDLQFKSLSLGDEARKSGSPVVNPKPSVTQQQGHNLIFGSLNRDILPKGAGSVLNQNQSLHRISEHLEDGLGLDRRLDKFPQNSVEVNENAQGNSSGLRGYKQESSSNSNDRINQRDNGNYKVIAPPPGFSSNTRNREYGYGRRSSDHSARVRKNDTSGNQFDSHGVPVGSNRTSSLASAVEESVIGHRGEDDEDLRPVGQENGTDDDRYLHSIVSEIESIGKSDKKHHRDKDYRSDKRGQWIMSQRIREVKSHIKCRSDINAFNGQFLAVFESLIPSDEEKIKQKQLLSLLNKLVSKEWPEARLYLYGSCANSFGFQKSDIDVCLEMDLGNIDKSTVLLKLADVFESDNLQNVQALTRARVPVVKLMDPVTGISCDICINNVLAVINTKLLHDYAKIDVRLRQLAFIVKHWAKSRGVNETYHGTLSSYAYVLMCINFLQQRQPPILPCLQGMPVTYYATVENVECAYFDDVEKLKNFGSGNGESIAQLVWAFFHYWAYCHDYSNDVISVRTGRTLSKRSKDWTRRVGNDRHLICIEDPFETSHDLGRVVDKFSIRVLREEFLRAAELLQFYPNPGETLFEPYIPV